MLNKFNKLINDIINENLNEATSVSKNLLYAFKAYIEYEIGKNFVTDVKHDEEYDDYSFSFYLDNKNNRFEVTTGMSDEDRNFIILSKPGDNGKLDEPNNNRLVLRSMDDDHLQQIMSNIWTKSEGIKDIVRNSVAAGLLTLPTLSSDAASTYKVKPGDTLSQIAKIHNTDVDTLAKLNNIVNVNKLSSGMTLKLSVSSDKAKSGDIEISDDFINYIKHVENSIKSGWKDGKWYPHNSPEGGNKTIAYGHKLKDGENFNNGLTEPEATDLLHRDIRLAKVKMFRELSKNGFKMDALTQEKAEMFLDLIFNVGSLTKFPKFTKAVMADDWNTAKSEYERSYVDNTGNTKKLGERNRQFYNRFLKDK